MRCKVCTRAISPEHLQLQPQTMCCTPGASERLDYVLAADLFQTLIAFGLFCLNPPL